MKNIRAHRRQNRARARESGIRRADQKRKHRRARAADSARNRRVDKIDSARGGGAGDFLRAFDFRGRAIDQQIDGAIRVRQNPVRIQMRGARLRPGGQHRHGGIAPDKRGGERFRERQARRRRPARARFRRYRSRPDRRPLFADSAPSAIPYCPSRRKRFCDSLARFGDSLASDLALYFRASISWARLRAAPISSGAPPISSSKSAKPRTCRAACGSRACAIS